jgi:ribosomal-protein-alanine N-acetyltransferase
MLDEANSRKMMFYKELETERLTLKNISSADREFIFEQFSNDKVNEYLYDAEPLTDIAGADEIIEFYTQPEPRGQHRWIITRKADLVKLGTCGFHCLDTTKGEVEIGFDLNDRFWGLGYAREAVGEIISFAKNSMKIKQIKAIIYIKNDRSIKVVEHFGFKKTGEQMDMFRNQEYLHNIYILELA